MFAATGEGRRLESFGFVSQETNHRFQWVRWVVEQHASHRGRQPDHALNEHVAADLLQDLEAVHAEG
ncbi:hypothetical protein F444_10855, partial [Phytophthora nicotianae P1976]